MSFKGRRTVEDLPLVFTAREAAEYLRFSEATILRMARTGRILGVKVGRIWRFSRETVLDLLSIPK